jgi:hypothetical protein
MNCSRPFKGLSSKTTLKYHTASRPDPLTHCSRCGENPSHSQNLTQLIQTLMIQSPVLTPSIQDVGIDEVELLKEVKL